MKTEIETRFLEIDKAVLISKLKALKAIDKGEVKLDEIIFYDKDLKWFDENKLVRLRKNKDVTKLTFKSNLEQRVDSTKEIEFTVSSFDDAKTLLEAVGLVAYRVVEKIRHTFIFNEVTIDIDTWPKIPTYVELEGDSVEKLKVAAKSLGLTWKDRFDGDPRYVYKRYGFDFDKIRILTFAKVE